MLTATRLIALGLTLAIAGARAQISSGNPLLGLEKLKEFETRRVSSADPNWENGNRDFGMVIPSTFKP